jgi:hypothetical protein
MGYVYFISQGVDNCKIGYSTNPQKRLKSLSTSSPLPLVLIGYLEGSKELEKQMHMKYHSNHLEREWFSLCPEIIDFINENTITNTYCEIDKDIVRVYKKMKK